MTSPDLMKRARELPDWLHPEQADDYRAAIAAAERRGAAREREACLRAVSSINAARGNIECSVHVAEALNEAERAIRNRTALAERAAADNAVIDAIEKD
jgi:hypothetical protein